MNENYPEYHPQFYTATILEWKHLLQEDKYKDIIINSLKFLVTEKRIRLFAFVIMKNHIHLIWQPLPPFSLNKIQQSFMSFTAHQMQLQLQKDTDPFLSQLKVNAKDRNYQFWERNPLGIDLYTHDVFIEKLNYIHWNPIKAGLCKLPEEYKYSSAKFYEGGLDDFGILTNYGE
jgi:putative transposase